ncbi:methylmalonyl-CoA epimerase, mitochondrial-like [Anneissia japonica]|uniref:methylmalonyl-CoA epimerase, mitochondrial-like n=1 Tax=Anneissia japonica TaxID=1529436 RepID=UPI0014254B14|nr:methylmalonyl-CoA epimerase, mitochondrial-like [Anneissia japonica]
MAGIFKTLLRTTSSFSRVFLSCSYSSGSSSKAWSIGRLNHVAIAVPNLDKATSLYRDILGAKVSDALPLPEHGVTTVFVELGNTKLELLHPLGESSPIQGFLNKKPDGGMHHICIEGGMTVEGAQDLFGGVRAIQTKSNDAFKVVGLCCSSSSYILKWYQQ